MAGREAGRMSDNKPERKYSNRYVEFLYHWDTTRRLKKQVAGPPEGYQHPNSIHGQRVLRLGRGIPPRDQQEDEELKMHRRRIIPNRSFQSHPDLLCPSRPSTAPAAGASTPHLFLDETRQRPLQVYSGRANMSSMKGAGVTVTAEAAPYKPWRARGSANPGHGLSDEMVQTLAFNPEAAEAVQQQQQQLLSRKLVWSVAPAPRAGVNILRHRMSDPASEPMAAKLEVVRPMTPNLQSCSAEERRSVFYGSLTAYAKNKVVGDYGSLRTNSGLRTLAGYVR